MALSHEQVQALLKLPEKSQRGRKPKNYIDTSVRDYQTWFKLATKFYESGTSERALCSNPNCPDTRDKKSVLVAEVNDVNMCRICFLNGYMSVNPAQLNVEE